MPRQKISHFTILDKLGEGGMGAVFRGRDERLGRDLAIKLLPAGVTADPERRARFERAARALAALNHSNVAAIHDVGEDDGAPFLVMELASGQSLDELLRTGSVSTDRILDWAMQIADGLAAAHAVGIIHRDLKPANVMVDDDGQVKLLDFGLAKALDEEGSPRDDDPTRTSGGTMAGVVMGTAAYMSPEQARGRALDQRTDVWAFGVMLLEALSGKNPFAGETISDTVAAVLRADIDLGDLGPDIPRPVRALLERCLSREAAERFRDMNDVRCCSTMQASGWARRSPRRPPPRCRSRPGRPGAGWPAACSSVRWRSERSAFWAEPASTAARTARAHRALVAPSAERVS